MIPITDNLMRDGSTTPIQIGSTIATKDNSGTPKNSPFTLTGGIDIIVPPLNAVEFIVNPLTTSLQISEDSTMTTYDVIATSTKESVPCAKMTAIYIRGTNGNVVNFRFTLI